MQYRSLSFGLIAMVSFMSFFAAKAPALAQDLDSSNWEFSVLGGFGSFGLDGQFQVFESPVAFGAAYTPVIDIGFFLAPVFQINEENTIVDLSTLFHARVLKKIGLGFGYTFWQSRLGLVQPQKSNLFFLLTYEILGPQTSRASREARQNPRVIHLE